jgi:hypothetical protein
MKLSSALLGSFLRVNKTVNCLSFWAALATVKAAACAPTKDRGKILKSSR